MRQLLGRWLFQFSNPSMDHLKDPGRSFSLTLNGYRERLLDDIMARTRAVTATTVWKVDVRTHGFYECDYEDVAFEEQERVIYFHAGVSD